ncbi:Holliday junction ATP-dependent DNA helicase RuvB [Rickettsiales endosymbiont of Paramecium tredecaurelia]|uniref:Holliday junction branch migration DNA helicase RuvB n=1 Tax=Candidatus Sarmatiella mevalonica TaxID=2770581 RepID=UPI001923A88F|nr:Holliday junction branch migration DNA helicase RuvB [Candidatus Sarmatiella mevalonica]MBL3284666.1 Holliday junction ATP-dependent DNA helicase RuvB [Candidatus Sarmatiella mevalonica]
MSTILCPQQLESDQDYSLRPSFLKEFIGQTNIKSNLLVFLDSAKKRNEPLDHCLFYGPPGLGKTTLAQIIAKEMNVNIKTTSAPALVKTADLAGILMNLKRGEILFIDEIHRMRIALEEMLYSAMEDLKLDLAIGQGSTARIARVDLAHFTLVAATTRLGLISNPLRSRFPISLRLELYSTEELHTVLARAAMMLKLNCSSDGLTEIAMRSRGTPRIALRILRRVRDFAIVENIQSTNVSYVQQILAKMEIDGLGLDSNDHRYLQFIYNNYNGGPVGLETIASGLNETKDSIEETIENYLIRIGFVNKTTKGRQLTHHAINYLLKKL